MLMSEIARAVAAFNVVRPRPPTLTSIPSLLTTFQNEWDALALETHTLRQQLVQTRQELSTALYQHDAATRVIARLLKERDEAREALSHVTVGAGTTTGEQMEVDAPLVPSYIQEKVEETKAEYVLPVMGAGGMGWIGMERRLMECDRLQAGRKKRPIPEGWATAETVSQFTVTFASEPLYPGSKALALEASGDLALVGGADGIAGVYSLSQQQPLHPLKAQDGAINDVAWAGKSAVTASASGTVRVWNEGGSDSIAVSAHAGDVVALAVHPSKSIVASAGADKSWVLTDIGAGKPVVKVYGQSSESPPVAPSPYMPRTPANAVLELTAAQFHPDGHLFALGALAEVKVFDIRSAEVAAALGPTAAAVSSLSFSENGYWLAMSLEASSTAEIWDLRRVAMTKNLDTGSRVDHVAWDYSGQFLSTAGPSGISVQHYLKATKSWSEPLRSAVAAVATAWGARGSSLASVSAAGVISILS